MKFNTANTIIYHSEADYQQKLLNRELKELEAEFEKIMLIKLVAETYTAKHPKK